MRNLPTTDDALMTTSLASAEPKPESAVPNSSCSPERMTSAKRALSDIIGSQYLSFDANARIARPFAEEAARDAAFEEEFSKMFLDLLLKTHAWAASRPRHAATQAGAALEAEIAQVTQMEFEQGTSRSYFSPPESIVETTRQRLNDFVNRMKNALAALMGTL